MGDKCLDKQKGPIVEFAKKIFAEEKRGITLKDLEKHYITIYDIRRLFGSLQELRMLADVPTNRRKLNMTDEDLKVFIQNLVRGKNDNSLCPSYQKLGTPCFSECNCWLTDNLCAGPDGRIRIKYKRKMKFLYVVTHHIFVAPTKEGMCILHLCDNPSCFNPDHLIQGTYEENAKQCVKRGRQKPGVGQNECHNIKDMYNSEELFAWIMANSDISERGEWLYRRGISAGGYPRITFKDKKYTLPRLVLAHKLNIPYEEVGITGHKFPENFPYSGEAPRRNDVNPAHLYNSTSKENSDDAKEYHKGCSLSKEDVKFIFDEANKTDFLKTPAMEFDMRLARHLNVSARIIRSIRTGKTYKNWHGNDAVFVRNRAVTQLSMKGEFIADYTSVAEAVKAVNAKVGTGIYKVCRGKQISSEGYLWMYKA